MIRHATIDHVSVSGLELTGKLPRNCCSSTIGQALTGFYENRKAA